MRIRVQDLVVAAAMLTQAMPEHLYAHLLVLVDNLPVSSTVELAYFGSYKTQKHTAFIRKEYEKMLQKISATGSVIFKHILRDIYVAGSCLFCHRSKRYITG